MKAIRDTYVGDRPREKIACKGVECLKNSELIAAIIGSGMPGRDVLQVATEIEKILNEAKGNPGYDNLLSVDGVGASKASQIVASFELVKRYMPRDAVKITKPHDILPLVDYLKVKKQEYFICVTLNGAGEVIENRVVTVGTLNHSPVHPREVFADAISDRAASVILVHNHPSGNPEPSADDIAVTERLLKSGEIVGISILDHIIIAKNGLVSLRERGYI
ncbi:RadC family protein [Methanoplanus endosymbiosus]|uniref:DNA repair protein RadC n=1 Tax=Methanoplanus endosymbiosus TaxID=33865 RepID=A0A9E7PR65_9EURY|nr:DNA repair protein RadC [Methanoplanus endosymbiosus]UUX93872.1 DNA repair protein RadC [Methanoplanus endosymbiosus]